VAASNFPVRGDVQRHAGGAQVLNDKPAPPVAQLDSTHAANLQALGSLPTGHGFDVQYGAL
jgi:hypothetical protein